MKKETWKLVIQILVSILTAMGTALGTVSCIGYNPALYRPLPRGSKRAWGMDRSEMSN